MNALIYAGSIMLMAWAAARAAAALARSCGSRAGACIGTCMGMADRDLCAMLIHIDRDVLAAIHWCTLAATAAILWCLGAGWMSPAAAVACGIILPSCVAALMRRRYRRRLQAQVVELFNLLSQALAAGLSLQQAFEVAAVDMPDPMARECRCCIERVRMGRSTEDALREWAARCNIEDMRMLAGAVAVLKRTGGNMIETFSELARTVSERNKARGRIRALTAQGVFQAAALVAMPFLLMLGLHVAAPGYVDPLVTTGPGRVMAAVGVAMQAAGAWWVWRIADIRP